jgi:hypothetical protein
MESDDGRHGYVPAAVKDWKAINKSCPEERKKVDRKTQRFLSMTDAVIENHLLGKETVAASIPRFMPPSKAVGTEYRYAVEQAVRYRRPVAIMIDEAQHLGKIPSGRRLLDQLDVVKSIANIHRQCEQMHSEAADGELKLNESSQAVMRLRGRLGLNMSAAKSDPKQPDPPAKFRRPGQRLPTRDVVGQMNANAAAL